MGHSEQQISVAISGLPNQAFGTCTTLVKLTHIPRGDYDPRISITVSRCMEAMAGINGDANC